ncbi:hypothetical protein RhiirC2_787423 [Rhizophagus irregularis]|uniref:Uncharacterized protein n=1 Tax=Rhizophagus irregularis TaxID=588596 RepID=A0A2N1MS80_9GLOM|nr:hypothetical protein RhiirC2_787423 [Rhizophagus irregularis]
MKKLKKVFEADGQNAEIGNYVEEQTGLEAGKELTDSSESSSAEEDSNQEIIGARPQATGFITVKNIKEDRIVSVFDYPKLLTSTVLKVKMESERQTKRILEGSSEKDLSNNLSSDLEELTKVFEKNLEGLENLVKLFKSDVSKMFNISDSNLPSRSIINASPEK